MARLILFALIACLFAPSDAEAAATPGPTRTVPRDTFGLPDPLVMRAQELLAEAEYYFGPKDGRMAPAIRRAIREYQRDNGFKDDGQASEALIKQLETGEKVGVLLRKLDATRAINIEKARKALLAHPETRKLLERGRADDVADPTRDPSPCFDDPAPGCLLHEALESAKTIHKTEMRDWALGEILAAQAKAGLLTEAMATARRISDPRLIMVALRDIAESQAVAGRPDDAIAAAEIIPDPLKKAEALAAIAAVQIGRGGAARATAERLAGILNDVDDALRRVSFRARAAVIMARSGEEKAARRLLDDAESLARADAANPESALRHVAGALADLERPAEALALAQDMASDSNKLPVLVSAATAYARSGDVQSALAAAEEIKEDRYRAIVLARIAQAQAQAGLETAAGETLDAAREAAGAAPFPFARSFAYSRVALALASMGDYGAAVEASDDVKDGQLRAQTLWSIAAMRAKAGDAVGAADMKALARKATDAIKSRLSRIWVYGDVSSHRAADGAMDAAWAAFAEGIEIVRTIRNAWGRSRALGKLAETLVELLEPSLRRAPKEPTMPNGGNGGYSPNQPHTTGAGME